METAKANFTIVVYTSFFWPLTLGGSGIIRFTFKSTSIKKKSEVKGLIIIHQRSKPAKSIESDTENWAVKKWVNLIDLYATCMHGSC